ncbi:hypothetical protein P4H66_23415 [Paenibacillus dokdonensis]|uniref:Phage protein n=1 Tax=Paenibacillus dokdonensis TaxID=2567944 RepID=A0ABU6GSN4_9BACL|nr:hypothetical protein [Paenibacillus dokdonensis]MEC0242764.1 hypothetical protein [Paenibacillus dokdonensis]
MNFDIEKVPVVLNGVERNLVFDLRAYYELNKRYDTLQKLVEEIKSESTESMPLILKMGFAHEENVPIADLELLIDTSNIKYLTLQTLQAVLHSLPDTNKYSEGQISQATDEDIAWDWDWLYYVGTVLLGMREAVFWRTLPRKLFALLGVHKKYNGADRDDTQDAPGGTAAWVDQYI